MDPRTTVRHLHDDDHDDEEIEEGPSPLPPPPTHPYSSDFQGFDPTKKKDVQEPGLRRKREVAVSLRWLRLLYNLRRRRIVGRDVVHPPPPPWGRQLRLRLKLLQIAALHHHRRLNPPPNVALLNPQPHPAVLPLEPALLTTRHSLAAVLPLLHHTHTQQTNQVVVPSGHSLTPRRRHTNPAASKERVPPPAMGLPPTSHAVNPGVPIRPPVAAPSPPAR